MGITHLSGLEVAGVPTMGINGAPLFTGNWFFVDPLNGSDGNPGTADFPVKTLGQAHTLCTDGNNDVVVLNGTATNHLTATLTWSKNFTHLIGMCSPVRRGKRARISPASGATAFAPLISVTATGCLFQNIQAFYGFDSATNNTICWQDTGGHNSYNNVEFMGFGDGTASTGTSNITGARAFKFNTNTGETTFRDCVFGVDTEARNVTNYTLEIAGNAPRLTFENCDFECLLGSSGGSSSHLLIGSAGIDRYCKFTECRFMNSTLSTGTAMTQALNVSGSAGGVVLLDRCTSFGATHWETTASGSVYLDMTAATAHDGGLAVEASPS